MIFGGPQGGRPPPQRKGGQGGKNDQSRRGSGSSFDPNDTTIEGNLKNVLTVTEAEELQRSQDAPMQADSTEVDAPLIRLVNSLLSEAVRRGASDIHMEPFEQMLRIRYRIDGVLHEIQKIPHKLAPAITSRLKIMADLDICEKRIPQDGAIRFRANAVEADFRISCLPSQFGEKIVMRVMGTQNVSNDLSKIGIPEYQLKLIREAIVKPEGLVLVTGPTGSGKTTTLYAALNELNDISVSVFTAEDPVEGTIPGVTQCGVNASVGYTFASILRSLLRQDPDVILVGEIRDQETAEISIKASLTGHLVLSTLHTNCAASTIQRLGNMNIPGYLLAASINCIVAQRLVRRICTDCKQERTVPKEVLEELGSGAATLQGKPLYHGKGCQTCHGSGYKGRAPVYEVLMMSDDLRRLIVKGGSKEEIKDLARIQGMVTLREAGLLLVRDGITTLEEVLGTTNEDNEVKPVTLDDDQTAVVESPVVMPSPVSVVSPPEGHAPTLVAVKPESHSSSTPKPGTESASGRWKRSTP